MGILLTNCCNAKLIVFLTFQDINSVHICSHYVGSSIGWRVTRLSSLPQSAKADSSLIRGSHLVCSLYITLNSLCNSRKTHWSEAEIPCTYVRTTLVATIGWNVSRSRHTFPSHAPVTRSRWSRSRLCLVLCRQGYQLQ